MDENYFNQIGLIDGKYVSSFLCELPNLKPKKLKKIITNFMSDKLVSDGSEDEIIFTPTTNKNKYLVLVCKKTVIQELINELNQNDKKYISIWPDYMGIPAPEAGVNCLKINDWVLFRREDGTGARVNKSAHELINSGKDINLYEDNIFEFPPGQGFASGVFAASIDYKKYFSIASQFKRPLTLLLIFIFLSISSVFYEITINNYNAKKNRIKAETIFKDEFPSVNKIVNIEVQTRNLLGLNDGSSKSNFIFLFKKISEIFTSENISFENVVFNDEENFPINITFSADNFSSIQKIKIKLEKEGLNVSEGKSEKIDNLIIGNIYIK